MTQETRLKWTALNRNLSVSKMLIDFNSKEEIRYWVAINDDVMGGISQGGLELSSSVTAIFSGCIALENNGGFVSVRRPIANESLKNCRGVTFKVKGEGRNYQFRVRTDDQYDGMAYRSVFATEAKKWQTVTLLFDCFRAGFRGRDIPDAPVLCPEHIKQVGFLLADKQSGSFCLELDWIKFF